MFLGFVHPELLRLGFSKTKKGSFNFGNLLKAFSRLDHKLQSMTEETNNSTKSISSLEKFKCKVNNRKLEQNFVDCEFLLYLYLSKLEPLLTSFHVIKLRDNERFCFFFLSPSW